MELNAESILDALNDFERKPSEIPPILEDYLLRIAQNGEIIFPWNKLKPLLMRKLEIVLDEFYETCPVEISVPVPNFETFNFDTLKKSILEDVDAFNSAPFTIQRLCELVTNPKKHYNRTDKYMRGIEKNVLVVSTIEPRLGVQNDGNNANVNPIVNGMFSEAPREDNDNFNNHENSDNVSSSNLNASSNHVLLENFANVFPSAPCIPSASNICINREIESNFLANSDCVETQEVEFESAVPSEQPEDEESKEEEMDTAAEENFSENTSEVTPNDPPVTSEDTVLIDEQTSKPEVVENQSLDTAAPQENDVTDSKNVKNEADCSESAEPPVSEMTESVNGCQQDDTVSQSDDTVSCENTSESSVDKSCDEAEAQPSLETVTEPTQSANTDNGSEQCMELESSTSEEPNV